MEVNAKYNRIGKGYNLTRKPDTHLVEKLVHHLNPDPTGIYLDIGCGTGNYTNILQKKGFQFIGVDPSEKMLAVARTKNKHVKWCIGSAEETSLESNSIDGIIAFLTIHHWHNLENAFHELHRIMKPGSFIVIFTSTQKQMKSYWLNNYFPKMLSDSIIQMPSFDIVEKTMTRIALKISETEKYDVEEDLQDKFLYCGKHNPELYFDEHVRQGISSFSDLAHRTEVEQGLLKLRQDIESGIIQKVIKSFENDLGDYLFIKAEKN